MMEIVVHFLHALAGPPTSWVPPGISPSPNPSLSKNGPPTSLWRGEGLVQVDFVHPRWLGVLVIEPTPFKRKEGLISGQLV